MDSKLHGPYWYAYWSEQGRTKSKYIGKKLPGEASELEQQTIARSSPSSKKRRSVDEKDSASGKPKPFDQDEFMEKGVKEILRIMKAKQGKH